jgi:phospholipase/carboxylesterase
MHDGYLEAVEINPGGEVRGTLFWLHGLGADGHDFESLIPELDIVERLGIRVVLPHAPKRPVTINGGTVMRAWYDIASMDFGAQQDSAGIRQSEQSLRQLIAGEEQRGVPANRIVLAGYSQGGAIVLHTGLRSDKPLAGILALSCYLPLADSLAGQASSENQTTPIMIVHGLQDPVVPIMLAEASRDALLSAGYPVEWHSYAMSHAVCPEEIRDIAGWLSGIFS